VDWLIGDLLEEKIRRDVLGLGTGLRRNDERGGGPASSARDGWWGGLLVD